MSTTTEGDFDGAKTLPRKERLAPSTVLGDRWEVLEFLGEGGMSTVYKTRHQVMGKVAAAKVLHAHLVFKDKNLQRFQQEGKASSIIDHPHVISVYDCGVSSDGRPFIMMEHLSGISLAELIAKEGPLPLDRSIAIFRQICDAMAAAHKKGVVHRDLKPSNVMLIDEGSQKDFVKIVDFGIARLLPREDLGETHHQLTQTGEIFGSPLYMSPEQCLGKKPDARSDIYSMGCLMYEVLSGRPPLKGESVLETLHKQCDDMPEPFARGKLGNVRNQVVEAVIFKALAKDPDLRYQSMEDLNRDLQAASSAMAPVKFIQTLAARDFLTRWRAAKKKEIFLVRLIVIVAALAFPLALAFVWFSNQMSKCADIPAGIATVHVTSWPRPWVVRAQPTPKYADVLQVKTMAVKRARAAFFSNPDTAVNDLVDALSRRADWSAENGYYAQAANDYLEASERRKTYLLKNNFSEEAILQDEPIIGLKIDEARNLYLSGQRTPADAIYSEVFRAWKTKLPHYSRNVMEALDNYAQLQLSKIYPDNKRAAEIYDLAAEVAKRGPKEHESKEEALNWFARFKCLSGEVLRLMGDPDQAREKALAEAWKQRSKDTDESLADEGTGKQALPSKSERGYLWESKRAYSRMRAHVSDVRRREPNLKLDPHVGVLSNWGEALLFAKYGVHKRAEESFQEAIAQVRKLNGSEWRQLEAQILKDYAIFLGQEKPIDALLVKLRAVDLWSHFTQGSQHP
ncbi:MAG TPA: serine/threonine-protein kinase [Candidatus Obscuribacterales bacterium]